MSAILVRKFLVHFCEIFGIVTFGRRNDLLGFGDGLCRDLSADPV